MPPIPLNEGVVMINFAVHQVKNLPFKKKPLYFEYYSIAFDRTTYIGRSADFKARSLTLKERIHIPFYLFNKIRILLKEKSFFKDKLLYENIFDFEDKNEESEIELFIGNLSDEFVGNESSDQVSSVVCSFSIPKKDFRYKSWFPELDHLVLAVTYDHSISDRKKLDITFKLMIINDKNKTVCVLGEVNTDVKWLNYAGNNKFFTKGGKTDIAIISLKHVPEVTIIPVVSVSGPLDYPPYLSIYGYYKQDERKGYLLKSDATYKINQEKLDMNGTFGSGELLQFNSYHCLKILRITKVKYESFMNYVDLASKYGPLIFTPDENWKIAQKSE